VRVDRGGDAVVVRVEVKNAGSAGALIQRLLDEVEAAEVSFEAVSQCVCVDLASDPDQGVSRVLRMVEEWLADSGGIATTVDINGRSYVLEPQVPLAETG
jgi:hypothetical protein